MQAIVSLLDTLHNTRVEALWNDLASRCGLVGIQMTPLPHFSWQGARAYDVQRLNPILSELTRSTQPFIARTAGLGVFTGPQPVIYVSLIKDETLLRFHSRVWQAVHDTASDLIPYYAPEAWMPHITLAYGDVTPKNAPCVFERLLLEPFQWEFPVDNLSIVQPSEKEIFDDCQVYRFGA